MDPFLSNFIFHDLSLHLIIELPLAFNHLIKPTTRFPTKNIKTINVINCIHRSGTTPWGYFLYETIDIVKGHSKVAAS